MYKHRPPTQYRAP